MTPHALMSPRAFVVWFRDLHRWNVGSFVRTDWHWPAEAIKPLAFALKRKIVNSNRSGKVRLVTLHFDGEMELRGTEAGDEFKGKLFNADPGDVIYSKIDVRNGAIGIIPEHYGSVCVSSEYPVYTVNPDVAEAPFVKVLFRTAAFRRTINSLISGASGRKRVQPADLEAIHVPLPALPVQRKIAETWEKARKKLDDAYITEGQIVQVLDTELRRSVLMESLKKPCIIVHWKNIGSLDIKSARAAAYRIDNPSCRCLEEFAEEATEIVKPWEQPEKDWPVYGVNNKEGVFFSHFQQGKDFNAPYKRIHKDWFFHNPTRSSVGSLGIVPEVPDDAITSPEYQVWRVTKDLLPGYVATLIATPFFIELIQVHRVGAVKQRLYVENLLQIPIPYIAEQSQRRIVAERERAMQLVAEAKANLNAAKSDVEAMILGMKSP